MLGINSRQFSLFDLFGGEIVPAPAPQAPRRCQRWRDRRDSYRPAGETIETRHYEVAEIFEDNPVKAFVAQHHYAISTPPIRWRFGLYHRIGALVGVCVFTIPMQDKVLTGVFPGLLEESTELGRLVLLDWVPANAESWFVARAFEQIRRRVRGVVSYSDPMPRRVEGAVVFPGHIGTVYQSLSATFLGRATPRTLRIFRRDGRVPSERSLQKIRKFERGWEGAVEELQRYGAGPFSRRDNPYAWLDTWLPRITVPLKHPGNFKYAFAFNRADKKRIERLSRDLAQPLARPLPYPKRAEVIS
jgi:hypothetical protein